MFVSLCILRCPAFTLISPIYALSVLKPFGIPSMYENKWVKFVQYTSAYLMINLSLLSLIAESVYLSTIDANSLFVIPPKCLCLIISLYTAILQSTAKINN